MAGIADKAGGPAHQSDGAVSGKLETSQSKQGNQAADVQTVGGGVKPTIERALLRQMGLELVAAGGLRHQTAILKRTYHPASSVQRHHRSPHAEKLATLPQSEANTSA